MYDIFSYTNKYLIYLGQTVSFYNKRFFIPGSGYGSPAPDPVLYLVYGNSRDWKGMIS